MMKIDSTTKLVPIIAAILAISLTTIYAASTTPPYSNQSYYPNFNNGCHGLWQLMATGWSWRRCLEVDKNNGEAKQLSQMWVVNN